MDIKLYTRLLNFRSYSRSSEQKVFRNWLRNYIERNISGTKTTLDKYGNLYVEKGDTSSVTVNCVVAHLDINQKQRTNVKVIHSGDFVFGFDTETGEQCGVGHDDKAGVYFAIQALKKFEYIKAFFPLDEEVGCIGSSHAESKFFKNVGFMVQLDRNGYGDISEYTNGVDVVTESTKEQLQELLQKYNYDWEFCICTDVGELVDLFEIQGVNISCGYSNEHTDREILRISWYENAEKFALELLEITDGNYYHIDTTSQYYQKQEKEVYRYYGSGSRDYDDYYDEYEVDSILNKTDEELQIEYRAELQKLASETTVPSTVIADKIEEWLEDIESAEYYYEIIYPKTKEMLYEYLQKFYQWSAFEDPIQ